MIAYVNVPWSVFSTAGAYKNLAAGATQRPRLMPVLVAVRFVFLECACGFFLALALTPNRGIAGCPVSGGQALRL